jgi:iron complex outermembrane receptor protein
MTTQPNSRRISSSQAFSQTANVITILTGCLARVVSVWLLTLATTIICTSEPSHAQTAPKDLAELSLEELMNVEVTSVSKKTERLSDAAAAIFVITREDIRRSGYTSIPEILRLAPNLHVARGSASGYLITARGFNSTNISSANKLLVLIDGRSVYSPLFSGVFWDVQDTLIEDIERIEVISGPGGTLWGSNAVNGVINIITRHSKDTTGGLVTLGTGTKEQNAGLRYGAKMGDNATFRVYGKTFERDHTVNGSGTDLHDSWHGRQVGLQIDWGRANDALMLQGEYYDGFVDQAGSLGDRRTAGGHFLGRWNRTLADGSAVQVQTYFDQTRTNQPGLFDENLQTYDIEAQHRFQLGARNEITWGVGYRLMHDDVTNSAALAFIPKVKSLSLVNVFLQDSFALTDHLQLTVGTKLEHNVYTGWEILPSARLSWKLREDTLLWSAISRGVRTPSRLDRDGFTPGQAPFVLAGGQNIHSETVTAYEIGYRGQPAARTSLSVTAYYNVYGDLRSIEPQPGGALPFVLGNKMEGNTWGTEIWGGYRVLDWWQLSAGHNWLQEKLRFKDDSLDPTGLKSAGNDPRTQFFARSGMNLTRTLELDATLRTLGKLPNPNVPAYTALDMRVGWTVSKGVEISLIGYNLLDHDHPEFQTGTAATRSEVARAFYAKIVWSY